MPIALYLVFAVRYGTFNLMTVVPDVWVLFPIMTVVGAGIISVLKLPQIKLNTFENRAVSQIGIVAALLACSVGVIGYGLSLSVPLSVPMLFGSFFFFASVVLRMTGLAVLRYILELKREKPVPVAIYGAGAAGIQMASALRQSREAQPMFFVDDNTTLHGLMISGLVVHHPSKLRSLIARHCVERILIAMPSAMPTRRQTLVRELSNLPVEVRVLPSYIDMMVGDAQENPLRAVSPDELLGRDKVALNTSEIARAYAGRVVMVTGAGGSIGSELCRQLIDCQPARIVMYEQSEFTLYSIDRDMHARVEGTNISITTCLGSVTDKARVSEVIASEGVDIVLHAAAYKHVPLVESNELEGAHNNVLGTQVVAACAQAAGIERMILVSTDKAVRPTNIMGATKRMAELVLQDIQTRSDSTKFAMVRFGNVLGSSGSVLPLFQAQIAAGGPVTVTHPEVTRFFMVIPEAARLVLLAGAYATGGDVFVLDMGKPQKIIDIAYKMIELSGRTVRDKKNPHGDIAVEITGLRPAEKLYEELLIDDASLIATPHPKILRAKEAMLSQIIVASMLSEIQACLEARDPLRFRTLVKLRVNGYQQLQEQQAIPAEAAEIIADNTHETDIAISYVGRGTN